MSSRDDLRRAVEVLTGVDLAHAVDMVAYADGDGSDRAVVVANSAGAARLHRDGPGEVLHGRSPVASQDPMARATYGEEVADPRPPNERHSYPLAAARLHSLFADPRAPDVAVVHTAAHYWPEDGGHLGEHGSLNVTQSRAPLLLSGAGVTARGILPDWTRTVDVGPTLAAAARVEVGQLDGLDGRARTDLLAPGAAYVVGLLWDGTSATDLLHSAGKGDLPAVARLLERGCALRGGALAEFPSSTLCNHTSALTGVGPGRHGVVGNAWLERSTGAVVPANDPTTWHRWAEWVRPGVQTVFERLAAERPGARTASVNEPVDRGAAYSTMARIRASGSADGAAAMRSLLPDPLESPYATPELVRADRSYAYWSAVDDAGLAQVRELFADPGTAPAFTWWNTTLTDAAHHAGGPRSDVARASLRDADRRLGAFLDLLDRLGIAAETAILLTADHGFEGADPDCRGRWGPALAAGGVRVRDVGAGFLYL